MRLLLTFSAVAAGFLFLAHKAVRPLRFPAALYLSALPIVFLGEAFVKNGVYAPLDIVYRWEPLAHYRAEYGIARQRTPLLVDVVDQHIPWRKAVREAVKHGTIPLWNRFQIGGEPLLAMPMSQVLHPGTWLGFLLPLPQAWTFDMALRVLLAALGAYLLTRELGCGEIAALFGATSWALCDFLLVGLGYPHAIGAAQLPLLVLGLRRISCGRPSGVAIAVTAMCLIVAGGHPETSLHSVAAGYVILSLLLLQESRGLRLPRLARALGAGALAAGLMAIVLLPFLEILPRTLEYGLRSQFAAQRRSVSLADAALAIETHVVPYATGVSGHSFVIPFGPEASAYAGLLVLPLAAVGLTVARRERAPFAAAGLLAALVAAGFPGVADAATRLPLFRIALNHRLVFVTAFVLTVFAATGVESLVRGEKHRLFFGASGAIAAVAVAVWVHRRPDMVALKMPSSYMALRLGIGLAALGAGVIAIWCAGVRPALAGTLLLAAQISTRYAENGRMYPVAPASAFYPPLDVLSGIDRTEPFRFSAFGMTFIPNMSALYELEDVRAYEALSLPSLTETYPLWSVAQPVWFNRTDDPTRPFLSFLNVRYFLVPSDYGTPPGWRVAASGRAGHLLENERVVPRAFLPNRVFCSTGDRDLEVMGRIADFGAEGVTPGCSPSRWITNPSGDVAIVRYRAGRLSLRVHASGPAVVATSLTAWPGWRVRVDGVRIQPIRYNHAFLGIRLGPGAHAVDFRYVPTGFLLGAATSATALIVAVFCLWRRKSREENPEPPGNM